MGKRSRKRNAGQTDAVAQAPPLEYLDADGNKLMLRAKPKPAGIARARDIKLSAAANIEDQWQRQSELLFELLAVEWVIYDLPITKPKELLGRYRMADSDTRAWVRQVIDKHLDALEITV